MLHAIKREIKDLARELLRDSAKDYLKYRKKRIGQVGPKKFKREIQFKCIINILGMLFCLGGIYYIFCLISCFK